MANRKWTDEQFIRAVNSSISVASTLSKLDLKATGGNYVQVYRTAERLGLDLQHFLGQGYLRGKTHNYSPKRSLDEILTINSNFSTSHLRKRLLKAGVKPHICETCLRATWQGSPVPLQIHHKNGIRDDHRLENISLLCPNCHAQTDTYCGRNIGKVSNNLKPPDGN